MPTNITPGLREPPADGLPGVVDKLCDVASQRKHEVTDPGRTAVDTSDGNRDSAANGLDSAASALHENAEGLPGGEKVTGFAHSAANKLSSTADYVRGHDVKAMLADVEKVVKNNPSASLLAAAVVGFLMGRAFRSND